MTTARKRQKETVARARAKVHLTERRCGRRRGPTPPSRGRSHPNVQALRRGAVGARARARQHEDVAAKLAASKPRPRRMSFERGASAGTASRLGWISPTTSVVLLRVELSPRALCSRPSMSTFSRSTCREAVLELGKSPATDPESPRFAAWAVNGALPQLALIPAIDPDQSVCSGDGRSGLRYSEWGLAGLGSASAGRKVRGGRARHTEQAGRPGTGSGTRAPPGPRSRRGLRSWPGRRAPQLLAPREFLLEANSWLLSRNQKRVDGHQPQPHRQWGSGRRVSAAARARPRRTEEAAGVAREPRDRRGQRTQKWSWRRIVFRSGGRDEQAEARVENADEGEANERSLHGIAPCALRPDRVLFLLP